MAPTPDTERQLRIDQLTLELARMRRDLQTAKERADRLAALVDELRPAKADLRRDAHDVETGESVRRG